MESRERQLMTLLTLTTQSLTELTASMTSMSFELLRCEDEVTRAAGRHMVDRMTTVSHGLREQWRLIAELSGSPMSDASFDNLPEISSPPPVLPLN